MYTQSTGKFILYHSNYSNKKIIINLHDPSAFLARLICLFGRLTILSILNKNKSQHYKSQIQNCCLRLSNSNDQKNLRIREKNVTLMI